MIQPGRILPVIDNSGVRTIRCIQVIGLRPRKKGYASQGDSIVGSVVNLRNKSNMDKGFITNIKNWKRGDLVKALIVRTIKGKDRSYGFGHKRSNTTGIKSCFPEGNAAILLHANGEDPLGTRIRGAIRTRVRAKGFLKVSSLGTEV